VEKSTDNLLARDRAEQTAPSCGASSRLGITPCRSTAAKDLPSVFASLDALAPPRRRGFLGGEGRTLTGLRCHDAEAIWSNFNQPAHRPLLAELAQLWVEPTAPVKKTVATTGAVGGQSVGADWERCPR